jgi:hypothetical protein
MAIMSKQKRLVEVANSYIGVKETGGDNKGPQVEAFQKALGGPAVQQSWCTDFVHYCAKQVDSEEGGTPYALYPSQLVVEVWNKTDSSLRLSAPEPGCMILWEHYKDGHKTGLGHTGIVTRVGVDEVDTVEGNTSDGSGINRNGDGVYSRKRPITSSPTSTMRVLGFLGIWKSQSEEQLPAEPTLEEIEEKLKGVEDDI